MIPRNKIIKGEKYTRSKTISKSKAQLETTVNLLKGMGYKVEIFTSKTADGKVVGYGIYYKAPSRIKNK